MPPAWLSAARPAPAPLTRSPPSLSSPLSALGIGLSLPRCGRKRCSGGASGELRPKLAKPGSAGDNSACDIAASGSAAAAFGAGRAPTEAGSRAASVRADDAESDDRRRVVTPSGGGRNSGIGGGPSVPRLVVAAAADAAAAAAAAADAAGRKRGAGATRATAGDAAAALDTPAAKASGMAKSSARLLCRADPPEPMIWNDSSCGADCRGCCTRRRFRRGGCSPSDGERGGVSGFSGSLAAAALGCDACRLSAPMSESRAALRSSLPDADTAAGAGGCGHAGTSAAAAATVASAAGGMGDDAAAPSCHV